jgi:predicted nucleic acid-binding protein
MSSPARRLACGGFLADLATQPHTVVRGLDDDLLGRGVALYRARPDKEWSLTDCISFVVMEEQGLTDALTGDRHFEQAGFQALLAAG